MHEMTVLRTLMHVELVFEPEPSASKPSTIQGGLVTEFEGPVF